MKPRAVPEPKRPPQDWRALLPCPFCDGAAKLLSSSMLDHPEWGSNACVVCTRCGAGGPCVEPGGYRPVEAMERHAIRLWNRRGSHQGAEWKLRRIAALLNTEFGGA